MGVLGGMGPAATVDFYAKLIRATPATSDQDHLRVVVWADPTVPDRSAALLSGGTDPTPRIEEGARALAAAGAELIAVPCNTAHAFLAGLADRVGVPLVDMIQEVAHVVRAMDPPVHRVGLLATTGTVRAGLYHERLAGVAEVLLPDEAGQEALMGAIHAVKSGRPTAEAERVVADLAGRLVDRGAQLVVAGCTELPLLLPPAGLGIPVLDPAVVLAEAVVARAR